MPTFYCNYCVDIRHGDGLPNEVTYADVHDYPTGDITENPSATAVGQQSHAPQVGYYSFRIFRSLFYFDTSSIPVGATITNVQLRFYVSQTYGISGRSYTIVVQNGQPTYPHNPAVSGDFLHSNYSGNGGEVAYGKYWKTITFNEGARSWVNKGGETKLALRINRDINNDAPPVPSGSDVNNEFVFIRHATNYYARLIITYTTLPVVTTQAATQIDYDCAMGNGTIVSGADITERGFEVKVHVDFFGVGPEIWWNLIGFKDEGEISYHDFGQRTGYLIKRETWTGTFEVGAYEGVLGKEGVGGSPMGFFNDALEECLPYTYRAWAENTVGKGYGDWIAFNTLCYPKGHLADDNAPLTSMVSPSSGGEYPIDDVVPPYFPPYPPYPPWDYPSWDYPDWVYPPPLDFVDYPEYGYEPWIPVYPPPIDVPSVDPYTPPGLLGRYGNFYYTKAYTKKQIDDLRQKCIYFMKDDIEYCLVLRHNIQVLRQFFNMVSDNIAGKDEFNSFKDILPTQHLNELYHRRLELNDFRAIINNFINNSIDNINTVNHNFDLVSGGLEDSTTSNNVGFVKIASGMKVIDEDNPDVERMKKVVDRLRIESKTNFNSIMTNLNKVKAIIT